MTDYGSMWHKSPETERIEHAAGPVEKVHAR